MPVNNLQNLSSVQLTKISDNPNALKTGDSVFVRVLASEGNGQFIVSFAGKKMSVFSERELDVGTAFKAFVKITNGKVFLHPQNESQNAKNVFSVKESETLIQLQSFLQDLGLPNDLISLKIIQYFQSSGMAFNVKIANKARAIGLRFPGRENQATEIALFLEQKGIDANIDTVMELLGLLYGDSHQQSPRHNQSDDTDEIFEKKERDTILLDSLYENSRDIFTKEVGLLALVNHTYVNPQHWVVLPFETMGKNAELNGSIRLLLNIDKKTVEKMVIFANLTGNNSFVVIYCTKSIIQNKSDYSLQFCFSKKDEFQNEKYFVDMLKNVLPQNMSFDISYNVELLENNVFTNDSTISFVRVDA